MTQHLKSLISKREVAFHKNGADSVQLRFYRNAVNRVRKTCKAKFYESNVKQMKKEKTQNLVEGGKTVKRNAG